MIIPFHKPYMTDDEVNAAAECVRNGWLTMGTKTIEFEKEFSRYTGVGESVAVNSCTAALHLALKCIGLEEGDEVLMPSMTFVATAEVVKYFKAVPVFCDIERDTHLISVDDIERKITKRTKAIIPVHYAGQSCDMDRILEIAKTHNLHVIEDAAHSFPSKYKNRRIGTIGDITCFSLYATKPLSAGEGGVITTANEEWLNKCKIWRLHGISKDAWKRYSASGSWEYDVLDNGYKYNTTDINSSIALAQLSKTDYMNSLRKEIAFRYDKNFKEIRNIHLYKIKDYNESSYHLYPIKIEIDNMTIARREFCALLKDHGISVSVHFIPLYLFSFYKSLGYKLEDYPDCNWVFDRIISLPIYPSMSGEEVDYVSDIVISLIKKYEKK